jgi:hypothetical protein
MGAKLREHASNIGSGALKWREGLSAQRALGEVTL